MHLIFALFFAVLAPGAAAFMAASGVHWLLATAVGVAILMFLAWCHRDPWTNQV